MTPQHPHHAPPYKRHGENVSVTFARTAPASPAVASLSLSPPDGKNVHLMSRAANLWGLRYTGIHQPLYPPGGHECSWNPRIRSYTCFIVLSWRNKEDSTISPLYEKDRSSPLRSRQQAASFRHRSSSQSPIVIVTRRVDAGCSVKPSYRSSVSPSHEVLGTLEATANNGRISLVACKLRTPHITRKLLSCVHVNRSAIHWRLRAVFPLLQSTPDFIRLWGFGRPPRRCPLTDSPPHEEFQPKSTSICPSERVILLQRCLPETMQGRLKISIR